MASSTAVNERGEQLADGLTGLGLDARGRGLMLAFAAPDAPELARRLLLEQRLVVNATGPGHHPAAAAADGVGRRGPGGADADQRGAVACRRRPMTDDR